MHQPNVSPNANKQMKKMKNIQKNMIIANKMYIKKWQTKCISNNPKQNI